MSQNYVNGSDLLVSAGGDAIGHCTSHSVTFSSDTKDRAVKPIATAPKSSSLYKSKGVTGLSISVKADGLVFYGETEGGFKKLLGMWKAGAPVELKLFERTKTTTPYLVGMFTVSSLEQSASAQDDATYSVTFDLAEAPTTIDEEKFLSAGDE